MTIYLKNKHTLQIEDFQFKCCIGKKGLALKKKRGIKRHQRELLQLNIFIIEQIV